MPSTGTRTARVVAATAIAALVSAGLVSCSDGSDNAVKKPRYSVTPGDQPVRAPGKKDTVDLSDPVAGAAFRTPAKQPNILMITVDDAAQGDMKYMPHLRHLMVDQGTTLTNGMAPTPICVPARASLDTGQYAHNHGAVTISGAGGGYAAFDDNDTLPVWLQDAGYDTMFIGKYLNGYGAKGTENEVPPGWTSWQATLDPTTYNFVKPTINNNGVVESHSTYSTTLFRDQTVDLLEQPRRTKKPWYMWVNYVAPHHGGPDAPDDPSVTHPDDPDPVHTTTPAKRDENTFDWLDLPKKPNMFEDTSDKGIAPPLHDTWSAPRREELREAHQQRVESLQAVDRALAKTVSTLRKTGQLDNTYVVMTSDNGYTLGEHNLTGKLWYFREIVGVPMYVRGPGIARGAKSGTPVTNADWAPTFAALAGATPTRTVDGVNVLPWLEKDVDTRVVPIEAYPVAGGTSPLYTGVVVGPWTYVKARGGRAEVYYRTVDPWQNSNLKRDPRYRSQTRALAKIARQYVDCAGEGCPTDFYR